MISEIGMWSKKSYKISKLHVSLAFGISTENQAIAVLASFIQFLLCKYILQRIFGVAEIRREKFRPPRKPKFINYDKR